MSLIMQLEAQDDIRPLPTRLSSLPMSTPATTISDASQDRKSEFSLSTNSEFGLASLSKDAAPVSEDALEQSPFCVKFFLDDADDVLNLPEWRKWSIAAIALLIEAWGNLISSIAAPAVEQLSHDLGVSVQAGRVTQAVFLYGFAIGAIIWSPLSEDYGRKPANIVAIALLVVTQVICAVAQTYPLMVVCRFFAGVCAACTVVSVGIIADLWQTEKQSWPVNTFALCGEMGAMVGPIIGTYINNRLGWRWSFWMMSITTGALLAAYVLTCPETRSGVILRQRAARLRKETGDERFFTMHEVELKRRTWREIVKVTLSRPLYMLFCEPIVLAFAVFDAFNYSIIYLALEMVPLVYQQWGFSQAGQNLLFVPMFIGCVIAYGLYYFQLKAEDYAAHRNDGEKPPESRLYWMIPAGVLFPISLFWFAWTSQGPPHAWEISAGALGLFGIATHVIFISVSDYTIAAYSTYAASAFGAQSLLREFMSGSMTLCAVRMYDGLGKLGASSLLGLFALLLAGIPPVLYFRGPQIRAASKFAIKIKESEAAARRRNEAARQERERYYSARQRYFADGQAAVPTHVRSGRQIISAKGMVFTPVSAMPALDSLAPVRHVATHTRCGRQIVPARVPSPDEMQRTHLSAPQRSTSTTSASVAAPTHFRSGRRMVPASEMAYLESLGRSPTPTSLVTRDMESRI